MDRRVRKTRKAIKTTLIDLMEKDDISKITVTEICNILDINRGTFYLHYESINDALLDIETEMVGNIRDIVMAHDPRNLRVIFRELDLLIRDRLREYRILTSGDSSHFVNFITREMKELFDQLSMEDSASAGRTKSQNYISAFLISGGIGVFIEWLRNDCDRPLNELLKDFIRYFNFRGDYIV